MPIRLIHLQFDQHLIDRNYLPDNFDYNVVHNRIDYGVKWYGGKHREKDWYHSEEGFRDWLYGMSNRGASQEKLTAYLRCGMGHFSLDEADGRWYQRDPDGYDSLPWEKVFEGALKSYVSIGYHRKFFRNG